MEGNMALRLSSRKFKGSDSLILFLREVIVYPGITTYEISRKHGRDYSRVYKDLRLLVEKDMLWMREDKRNGRKIHRLYATDSVNTALAS